MPATLLGLLKVIIAIGKPEQIVCVRTEPATVGRGLTLTVSVKVYGSQLPEVPVTVYVAVCVILVGLLRTSLIDGWPLWAVPPVIPPVTAGAPQE